MKLKHIYLCLIVCICFLLSACFFNDDRDVGLEVRYNGIAIGFIEHETDFDEAVRIMRSRFFSSADAPIITPEFVLRELRGDEMYARPNELADNLIKASGVAIEEAAGFFVDGVFYGATTDVHALLEALDNILTNSSPRFEGERVEFFYPVRIESAIYPASSITPLNDILSKAGPFLSVITIFSE